jgi:hypothetical protein
VKGDAVSLLQKPADTDDFEETWDLLRDIDPAGKLPLSIAGLN